MVYKSKKSSMYGLIDRVIAQIDQEQSLDKAKLYLMCIRKLGVTETQIDRYLALLERAGEIKLNKRTIKKQGN